MVFHLYGSCEDRGPHGMRGGKRGDLSGQHYWTEVDGIRWEIESERRRPRDPALWSASYFNDGGRDLNDMTHDEILEAWVVVVGTSRAELEEQILEATRELQPC